MKTIYVIVEHFAKNERIVSINLAATDTRKKAKFIQKEREKNKGKSIAGAILIEVEIEKIRML